MESTDAINWAEVDQDLRAAGYDYNKLSIYVRPQDQTNKIVLIRGIGLSCASITCDLLYDRKQNRWAVGTRRPSGLFIELPALEASSLLTFRWRINNPRKKGADK